jgi:hypothetical protein
MSHYTCKGCGQRYDCCTCPQSPPTPPTRVLPRLRKELRKKNDEKFCLVCGATKPCMTEADLKPDDPGIPCTFDPTPQELFDDNARLRKELEKRNDGAVYGIIDPDYGRAYTLIRKLAWDQGYAIGLHGSFTRDLDLIAVPWQEDRTFDPQHLVNRIVDATGMMCARPEPTKKAHGRLVWTLLFPTFGDPRFIDLSILPVPPCN